MYIDKDITKYIVYYEDSILRAMEKISANQRRIVFTVGQSGELHGVLTDGDFRRWLIAQSDIDLNRPVCEAANADYRFCYEGDPAERVSALLSQRIECIPLVDRQHRLVGVASIRSRDIEIEGHVIGEGAPVFVIAEIGNNHNGDVNLARKLVDQAVWAGADCAKFQMRDLETLYANRGDADDASEDLGSQYVLDLLSRFQLSDDDLFSVFDYCRKRGIIPLCTPWDSRSVDQLEAYGVSAYKIASADLTNHDLLRYVAGKHKPMICSTGMSTEREIRESASLLGRLGAPYALLHCNSTYPAPFRDINLNYLKRLREIGNCPVGYSGHERGTSVAVAAVAFGAKVIEKHFTLDKKMEGNDHKVSLLPDEFREMVQGIREVEVSLGTADGRRVSQGELINRETLAKSLMVNRNVSQGELITADMLDVRSPGKGLAPYRKNDLVGRPARRDLKAGDFLYPADCGDGRTEPREYEFRRPFGVPVRYHDVQGILSMSNFDLLEFHLSYKDLEVDVGTVFTEPLACGLVVHSPELFSGDHILDLCAENADYRARSISELSRVTAVTRQLKKYFPSTERPMIVVNVGGFTHDAFLPEPERARLYEIVAQSLASIDGEGIEFIIQTMPPFPWHFGGQRFHNLFVGADEIVAFCVEHKTRICLDVSHSKLACNHYGWSFRNFIRAVAPHTGHLHIADAGGSDGEGLQIGEGEIDFADLTEGLDVGASAASFIPEIWQGHKNGGEGFWFALDRLEKWMGRARN